MKAPSAPIASNIGMIASKALMAFPSLSYLLMKFVMSAFLVSAIMVFLSPNSLISPETVAICLSKALMSPSNYPMVVMVLAKSVPYVDNFPLILPISVSMDPNLEALALVKLVCYNTVLLIASVISRMTSSVFDPFSNCIRMAENKVSA